MSDPKSPDSSSDECDTAVDDALAQMTRDDTGADDAEQHDVGISMADFGNEEGRQLAGAEPFQNGDAAGHIASPTRQASDDNTELRFKQDKDSDDGVWTTAGRESRKQDSSDDSVQDEIRYQEDGDSANESSRVVTFQDIGEDADLSASLNRLEVEIPALPKYSRDEYSTIRSDIVDAVLEYDQSLDSCKVEFSDGRIEAIFIHRLPGFRNGEAALAEFLEGPSMTGNLRKRKYADDNDWHPDLGSGEEEAPSDCIELVADDSDESVRQSGRRSLRTAQRPNIVLTRQRRGPKQSENKYEDAKRDSLPSRSLRRRPSNPPSYYGPEVNRDNPISQDADSDDDFRPIVSDLAPVRKGRRLGRASSRKLVHRRPNGGGSDIEFEPLRRSSRTTKNLQIMDDNFDFDDDGDFVGTDTVKERDAPKFISVKEIFPATSPESSFAVAHMQKCHTCAGSKQKGQLIYCQGCSLTFHKGCIGYRSAREHHVTKVGEDFFVLQCKYCIGVYTTRDSTAPKYDMCQHCKKPGASCSAFSKKLTARQEEKMRDDNNGVDPVVSVALTLINNSTNVLFRCQDCHRGWHQHHMAVKNGVESDFSKSTSRQWRCPDCLAMSKKIHRLVAWRLVSHYSPTKGNLVPLWQDVSEDDKEYLVKWETKSYAHCTWIPGALVFGITAGVMRKAFGKRHLEQSLLISEAKDAIPDEFLAPEIILIAKMASTAPIAHSKEDMLQNITHISRIYVKFQGLGYDDVVWDTPPTPEMTAIYPAFVDAYGEYVNGKYFNHEPQSAIRSRVEAFQQEAFQQLHAQPEGIKRGKLMGYQLEGLNWLLGNYHHGRSVVLADEMGLGKTVQVVSLVTSLVQDSPKCWPFLIVVPNSTCPNWRREFRQWAPDIRVVAYHGGRESQELTYQYELFPERGGGMRSHVVIMSYDSAQDPKTAGLFRQVKWAGLVVDEGQRLKNDRNLLYQALRGMKIPFRLLLTGTPLQNNKRELFNLIQFIDQTQNAAALDEQFAVLDKESLPKLHDKIRPYFLRRTKAGVLKFLPPMAQIIVPVTMTVVQEKLAKSIMAKNPELIKAIFAEGKLRSTDRGSLNNILMQLRKCLCHPFIYSDNIEEKNDDPAVMHRNLVEASAKLLLLNIMLPKLKERGHRVLIFSQFLNQLDILEDFLSGIGFGYRRLDGGMSSLEKQKRIDAFNAPDSPLFAFLLSTRAGGVGINLASADTVIIMDPDFNPHQDLQALSRAHRIGQKNKVLCFQLMTKDSVEERIVQVGRSKMALDHALIESMDDEELEGADLESILKHGAAALFNDSFQKAEIKYTSAMVERLLDRSQLVQAEIEENNSESETPFAYARVWDSENLGFDNLSTAESQAPVPLSSGVWDKIIAQREEEARRKAEENREILGRGGRRRTKVNYNSRDDAQRLDRDAPVSSESDEFSGKDSSSESDDDFAKEEQGAADRQLTDQTNTDRRHIQTQQAEIKAEPARHTGSKKAASKKVTVSSFEQEADARYVKATVTNGVQVDRPLRHGQRQDGRVGNAPRVMQLRAEAAPVTKKLTSFVPDEFWLYVAGLATEREIRIAIDEAAHSKDMRAVKQIRLYALHEKLREVHATKTATT